MTSNTLTKNLHERLFFLLILLLPTQLGLHFWPEWATVFGIRVDYLAPTVYLTDLIVMGVLVSWWWESRKSINYQVLSIKYLVFVLPFVYLLSTSLLAQNQGTAFYKLAKIVEFALLGFYIYKTKPFSIINFPLSIALLYSTLLAWFQFISGHTLGLWILGERTFNASTPGIALVTLNGQDYLRPYATFPHPNVLAGFLLVGIILIYELRRNKNAPPLFYSFTLLLSLSALIITFSHSAWFAGAALLFISVIQAFRRRLAVIGRSLLIILIAGSFLIVWVGRNLKDFPQEVGQRLELSSVALRMAEDFPLTGVGLNNFIVRLPEYGISPGTTWFLQPVHNIFLLVLAETGIIGFLFFLWFLFSFLGKLEIGTGDPSGVWKLAIPFLVILITGMADHYWLTLQQGQLLTAIVVGMALSKIGEN